MLDRADAVLWLQARARCVATQPAWAAAASVAVGAGAAVVGGGVLGGSVVVAAVVGADVVAVEAGASVAARVGESGIVVDGALPAACRDDERPGAGNEEGPPIHPPHFHARAVPACSRVVSVRAAAWPCRMQAGMPRPR